MTPSASSPRRSGIVDAGLALGAFAIGTTEFATMSILQLVWALALAIDRRGVAPPFGRPHAYQQA